MGYALVALLIATSTVALAEKRPQLTWEGYVTGGAILFVHGNQVDVQGRETGSVDRPRVSFAKPLPPVPQVVRIEVARGRGRVEVVEQPVAENEFTAVVRIDPGERKAEPYRIRFFWDAR